MKEMSTKDLEEIKEVSKLEGRCGRRLSKCRM